MICRCVLNRLIPLKKDHINRLKNYEQFIRDVAYLNIEEVKDIILTKKYILDRVLAIIVPHIHLRFSYLFITSSFQYVI